MSKNIVHLCDCMDFMRGLPDKAYDLSIVDPPYGIGDFTNKTLSKKRHVTISKFSGTVKWNDSTPEQKYFIELNRISKNQIIWGANYYNCFSTGGSIIWNKNKTHPNMSVCEIASYSGHKHVDYVFIQWNSLNRNEYTIHPCQKPVALYKWLLQKYAKTGQTIFDSHVGSGSIRIACHDLGFDFEGCELDPDYWQAQEERFKNHVAQPEIFDKQEIYQQDNIDFE